MGEVEADWIWGVLTMAGDGWEMGGRLILVVLGWFGENWRL